MRLLDHIFDDMIVEEFSVKIILPEGSVVGKLNTPYPMKREKDTKHFTYLDTKGRPVINIRSIQVKEYIWGACR
jgi:oligosaccharyltransferase complex subunit alpha (ribophorin I)